MWNHYFSEKSLPALGNNRWAHRHNIDSLNPYNSYKTNTEDMTSMLLRKIQYLQRSGNGTAKHSADDPSTPLSPVAVPAQKQLKYSAGIVNSPSEGIAALNKEQLKVLSNISLSVTIIIVS